MKKFLLLFLMAVALFLSSCTTGMSSFKQNDGFGYQSTRSVNLLSAEQNLN